MKDAIIVNHNPDNLPITHAVIWLHGLGANGHDFVPVVPELGLSGVGVRFIFPNAPMMPVTINGGYVMPAWYDILEMGDLSRRVDTAQIERSAARMVAMMDALADDGIARENIIIAGFSQGGAVAYHVAMTELKRGNRLGGLLALSTYFATAGEFSADGIGMDKALPVFIGHGTYDDVVSIRLGEQALNAIQALGFAPEFKRYPMAHQVCMEEIKDIGRWLIGCFKA